MRNTGIMAAAALVLAACGGGDQQQQAQPAAAPAAEAPAAAAGAVHDVNMVLEGTAYKYVPAELTIKPGDKVRFHNVSGGPHNVQFWTDSIPAGTADALDALMPGDKLGQLNGPLMIEPNAVYEITFANLPGGEYKYFCTPHLAMNMTGKITIAP
jgi:plastocyanin